MSNGPATRLGMVRCEHCQRQFNPHSAARHIPWCKKQNETRKRHLTADKLEALERYRWRIGYKPSNLISNQLRNYADSNNQQQRNRQQPSRRASHNGSRNYREEDENSQEGGEFSGEENSENEVHHRDRSRSLVATQRAGHIEKRAPNGSNSSATFSSPSASSITSLNNSVASTVNNNKLNHVRADAIPSKQQQRSAAASRSQHRKLVRSVSTLTIDKAHVPGSASSRVSRVSADAPSSRDPRGRSRAPGQIGATNSTQLGQMRAKSVSDLSNMGELVESLAKRMEEIYAQNQLLLDSIIRRKFACDNEATAAALNENRDERDDRANETDDDGWNEFGRCHHCRARCLVEANYCHKCGCKMRPSNPTPSTPE